MAATLTSCASPPAASGTTAAGGPAVAVVPTSGAPGAPAVSTTLPAPIKARTAYTTISAVVAPWWMAEAGGYFREQGLDVEMARVDPGATLLAALRNGELDITYSGAPAIALGYLQGLETMIVGATSNGFDTVIFGRPDTQDVEQLRGKTVGVNRLKAITDVGARMGLQRLGFQPDVDVFTRATGGQAESLAALDAGLIDGVAISPPGVFEARRRGYRELVNVNDMRLPFMNSVVGATRQTLAQRPELVERFLRAVAQAMSRLRTDREFSIAVLSKYTQLDDREVLGDTVDYFRYTYTVDPYPEPAMLQSVLDAEEHPAARTTRPEEIIDARFAEALRRSGFLDSLPR